MYYFPLKYVFLCSFLLPSLLVAPQRVRGKITPAPAQAEDDKARDRVQGKAPAREKRRKEMMTTLNKKW